AIEGIVHTAASARAEAARLLADAVGIAQSLPDEYQKASALTNIARVMAAIDVGRADRLIDDAERTAQAITEEDWKASALAGIPEAIAATDPDRAERTARSITNK